MGKNLDKNISKRKKEHVNITLTENVNFMKKGAGFDFFDFEHNALPELNERNIDTSIKFLNKKLEFPLMISGMTGGYSDAKYINKSLAKICEDRGLAFGVGSQRQLLENSNFLKSYSVIRKYAPNIPIIGNIGASEVAEIKEVKNIEELINLVGADALAVHLNPLQEFLQPEGNTNFKGVLRGIEVLINKLNIPIIVKEIGAGISQTVARKLIDIGIKIIDTAGAGGTSWAGIEIIRRKEPLLSNAFWDWGIPTAKAIVDIRKLSSRFFLIGSGGIRSGVDIAKSIALGADMSGVAAPILIALLNNNEKGVHKLLDLWERELRGVMFLTGSKNIKSLKRKKLHKKHS